MLWWMLRVDSWLDVASLENVENNHSFLFSKKSLMKIFFGLLNFFVFSKNFGNPEFFEGIENFDWCFFFLFFLSNRRSTSPMPLVLRPFIEIFFLFFFEKPILWMRITLAGSWCGLLDKSLLNSCKKIISISNGFIHWNELEVLTQCP